MAEDEPRGICVRDVAARDFIAAYAEHLKNSDKFELPVWADLVKTACHKELAPTAMTGTTSVSLPSPARSTSARDLA